MVLIEYNKHIKKSLLSCKIKIKFLFSAPQLKDSLLAFCEKNCIIDEFKKKK